MFPRNSFAGTAEYYLRYRLPYPRVLLDDLLARSQIGDGGRLLDLASGPGRVALALAHRFREVLAVDLEQEMIAEGRREAAARGITNIDWIAGMAEELEVPVASFDLVTIGEAFHRLDQGIVAVKSFSCLKPGSSIATLGSYSIFGGRESWHRAVLDVLSRWTTFPIPAPCARVGARTHHNEPATHENALREAGFTEVATHSFEERNQWTIGSILGFLYSTSVCSKRILGSKVETFERELTAALLTIDKGGAYMESTLWGYTFGRKPH
jgi:ubiquinone/menaquinone biosynthesis C-methylase UbiE